uniref:Uncharacterized protein n=1 Tax=Anguilla anguilla TaxID=7936 RepID=A0A0E9S8M7_ANGAN
MLHSWHCLCRMPTLREGSKSTKFVNSLSYCALVNTQAFCSLFQLHHHHNFSKVL